MAVTGTDDFWRFFVRKTWCDRITPDHSEDIRKCMPLHSVFDRQTFERLAVRANYDGRVLAALCGVSPRQLQRVFKARLQCSPQTWLNQLRVFHAQERLLKGESVKGVAATLGFRRAAYFSIHFKALTGLTPSEYRLNQHVSKT
jgi:AraC-like DNA-binding protein